MSDLRATHIFEIRINAEGDKLCLANPSNDDSGAYRIAGPKAWGGSSLVEDIEIRESNLVTYIKDYAPHLAPIIASDLIEQQQAEIDALKAHVEQLHAALRHLHHNAKASGAEMGLALDVAEEALESTPQQNLNTVKRSALLELANGLKNNDPYTPALMGSGDIRKYANTNYPSGKE